MRSGSQSILSYAQTRLERLCCLPLVPFVLTSCTPPQQPRSIDWSPLLARSRSAPLHVALPTRADLSKLGCTPPSHAAPRSAFPTRVPPAPACWPPRAVAKQAKALEAKLRIQAGEEEEAGEEEGDEAEGRRRGWGAGKRAYYGADLADLEVGHSQG